MPSRRSILLSAAALIAVGAGVVAALPSGTPDGPARGAMVGGGAQVMTPLPKTVTLRRQEIGSLLAEPDGSLRFATYGLTTDEDGETQNADDFGIGAVTASGRARSVFAFPTTSAKQQVAEPVVSLSETGSVVAEKRYPIRDRASAGEGVIHVVSRDRRGAVEADDALDLPDGGFAEDVVTGPTGAVAVTGIRNPADRTIEFQPKWLAFKPSGAAHVGPLVTLDDGRQQVPSEVLLGPDGGGVVISRPPEAAPFVRRISPAGALGPRLALARPPTRFSNVVAAFGPDGALHLMLSGGPGGDLFTAILPAGTSAPSVPRRVPGGRGGVVLEARSMAFGPDGRMIVAASRPERGFNLFEGRGTALTRTASVWAATRPPTVLVDRDGTTTLVWEDGVRSLPDDTRIIAMRRPAGGTFGRAVQVSDPDLPPLTLDDAALTADGNVAVAYDQSDPDRSYVVPRIWP